VLKNRATGKELFVVVISLLPTEEVKAEEKSGKEEAKGDDDLD
jgi:hypothetical protein